ncbi:unnamed protein product [Ectocarpus sp. CCAP 1310/34]|nr:unnamed protein product [Ectocarpus sp. CCAP 1310/34]
MVLSKVLRTSFEARHVEPDSNCWWRSLSLSFLDSDCFWLQLKLVSLVHAAANVDQFSLLVPGGKIDHDIFVEHSQDAYVVYGDGSTKFVQADVCRDKMVMASIARLCKPGAFAGAVAWVAASEALGVPANVMHPMDTTARKRMDLGLVRWCGAGGGWGGISMDLLPPPTEDPPVAFA